MKREGQDTRDTEKQIGFFFTKTKYNYTTQSSKHLQKIIKIAILVKRRITFFYKYFICNELINSIVIHVRNRNVPIN